MLGMGIGEGIVVVVYVLVGIVPMWRVVRKAGFPMWLRLFTVIPGVGAVVVLIMAFVEWPVQRELDALKAGQRVAAGGDKWR